MPDYIESPEDRRQRLLLSLMSAGLGFMGTPNNQIGQGLGRAGLLGLSANEQLKQDARRNALTQIEVQQHQQQLAMQKQQMEEQQRLRNVMQQAQQRALIPGLPGQPAIEAATPGDVWQPPVQPQPSGFNDARYINELKMGGLPMQAAQYASQVAKDSPYDKPKPEHYTPESLRSYARSGDIGSLVPIAKENQMVGKVNPADFTPASMAQFFASGSRDYSVLVPIDKRSITNVSVKTGEDEFTKQYGGFQVKVLENEQKAAQRANETIYALNEARNAIAGGAYQGGLATQKADTVNVLKGIGFQVDDRTLANTGALKSAMGRFVLQHAKDLGSNPSNADAKRIEQIIGTIDTDPGALNKLIDYMDGMSRRSIKSYNGKIQQVQQNSRAFAGYDMQVPEPEPWKPQATQSNGTAPTGKRGRWNPITKRTEWD